MEAIKFVVNIKYLRDILATTQEIDKLIKNYTVLPIYNCRKVCREGFNKQMGLIPIGKKR